MASSISSLGLGSDGVLSYDIIDKLKAVDEKTQLDPIDAKLTTNKSKQSDLSVLTTLTASLKSVTSTLSDEMSYLKRTTTVSNTAVSVTANSGSAIQDFSIHVESLAQRDIYQSNAFTLETSTFGSSTTTPAGTVVAPAATATQGDVGVTESVALDFNVADMSYGDSLTIGGLTLTATGKMTEAEVVAAFANLSAGATTGNAVANGTWSGTLIGFNSGVANGTSLTFTSTTADTNVDDLVVSATQEAGGTDTVPSNYTLSLALDGKTYDLDMTSGTTLTQFKDMINDKTEGKINASIINVGGANPYRLVIKSAQTGESNAINFSSTSISALRNLGLDNDSLSTNKLQTASDASFTYNGVAVTRSTNTISDLSSGLTITLNEKQASGVVTNISVKQNLDDIKSSLTSFVTKYNELMSNLQAATKYNNDTKTAGIFQGVSQINTLKSAMSKQLLTTDELGRSLSDYGLALNSSGTLKFTESTFNTKVSNDAKDVEDFFRGSTSYKTNKFAGSTVAAGDLSFADQELVINGISISFSTTGNTAEDNALALQNAINKAGISGVQALIGKNNSVYLESKTGMDIKIKGDAAKLTSIGFSATSVYAQSVSRDGVFKDFNELLGSYITGEKSIFKLFEASLTTEKTALTKNRASAVKRIDERYEMMATRFAAYDSIISKLNNQFNALSQMIDAAANNDN